MTRALVTGAAGQDGMILCTRLTREGAHVVGLVKPGTDTELLRRYVPGVEILEIDMTDVAALRSAAVELAPDEIYNLGGFTAPALSWEHEDEVRAINVDAVAALLEAAAKRPGTRLVQASSALIFEGADAFPQNERTRRAPVSPYGRSKVEAMELIDAARDRGMHAVSAILYNHESPLRGEHFVTRKISMAVARIARGQQDVVELGDIEGARDWGWAPDYVTGMQLMMRTDVPHDYVLATEISHRLSFFLQRAFAAAGIPDWRAHVVSHTDHARPADTNKSVGDSRAAYTELGWRHTVDFDTMAAAMVHHDLALVDDPNTLWPIPVLD